MARADNVMDTYRRRSTELLEALNEINSVLVAVEGIGADDPTRQAFFTDFFANQEGYDLDATTFFSSVQKWRELRTWLTTAANFVPLNKTRIR